MVIIIYILLGFLLGECDFLIFRFILCFLWGLLFTGEGTCGFIFSGTFLII